MLIPSFDKLDLPEIDGPIAHQMCTDSGICDVSVLPSCGFVKVNGIHLVSQHHHSSLEIFFSQFFKDESSPVLQD